MLVDSRLCRCCFAASALHRLQYFFVWSDRLQEWLGVADQRRQQAVVFCACFSLPFSFQRGVMTSCRLLGRLLYRLFFLTLNRFFFVSHILSLAGVCLSLSTCIPVNGRCDTETAWKGVKQRHPATYRWCVRARF